MRLVIDANPFISGFLRDSATRKIMLSEKIQLYSPDWMKDEFERNEEGLKKKFPASADFAETKKILFSFVTLVPAAYYEELLEDARNLTPHSKDVPYFALALQMKCPLWSAEKEFKKQSRAKIFSTAELLKELHFH